MKRLLRLGFLAGIVAGLSAAALWVSLSYPYQGKSGETFVQFEHGSSARSLGQSLADSGVIRYPWQFWIVRALRPSSTLQAGEYRFAGPATVLDVFDRIARGDVYHFDFTVPEGSNMFDIARLLDSQGVFDGESFLTAASDPALIRDLAPEAKSLEGYLFPSTYRLAHSTTPAQLCRLMTQAFRREWQKAAGGQTNVHAAVTLASLVEKETGVPEERPLVASVFANRLKVPMRLDCDPTVIYAALLEKRYDGVINRSDLNRKNPYNTYQNDGLPPGPIANPGAASLAAALHPAGSSYLYFVARPEGGSHVFSSTLAAHQKAVQSYRHGAQSKSKTAPKAPRKAV